MRLYVRCGKLNQCLLVGDAQQFVDTEDFILVMKKFVKPCGNVDNMFIDFENTQIPVSNVSEIRVIAQMAAAYQNACLAQNLTDQRDLYGNNYGLEESDSGKTNTNKNIVNDVNKALYTTVKHKKKFIKNKDTMSSEGKKTSDKNTWDEEMHGEQIVYDVHYEMNEHLVPWLMDPTAWEEKYGLY
jgi:hypothetical protein